MVINELKGIRLGIDMGGTLTKFLVLSEGEKLYMESFPTPKESCEAIIDFIANRYTEISKRFNVERIGIGVPGVVKNDLVYADNLPIDNAPMKELLEEKIGKPITIDNDANCATLAESKLSNRGCKDLVMITLGTGIGGGMVIDGKLRRGKGGMGEVCHMSIEATNGEICACGHKGCWESYASTTALVKCAEQAALENRKSYLYKLYKRNDKLNGILIFDAIKQKCPIAQDVFSKYLDRLAVGIKNLVYILDPEIVVLAGGITKDGDMFIDELKKRVNVDVKIEISTLQNEAGAFGAAML